MQSKVKTQTLKQLAQSYSVSVQTFRRWLKKVDLYNPKRQTKLFTPKEVKEIYEKLGEP